MLFLSISIAFSISYGQGSLELKGTVVDENNVPLLGASVILHPLQRGIITDAMGGFVFKNIPNGKYTIEISFIGYKNFMDTISMIDNKTYNVKLTVSSLDLQEMIVTDNYAENRKKEESLNIEIVNDQYLKQNMGGSLLKSLERLPGISTIDIGSGQSKPVIRGLGFNRVMVIENNIKHESQQWGADHGLEIDQYSIDNVEILKGPASLMYGSDAIGGVIDMKNRNTPSENTLGGTIDLSGKTNNNFLGSSFSLYGRKKSFFADLRATFVEYGDYKIPADSVDIYSYRAAIYKNQLRNTAGNEQNLHLSVGIIKKKLQSKFHISSVNNKSGFFANAHGLEPRNIDTELHDKSSRDILFPYQMVSHLKITNTSEYTWDKLKLECDIGFQRNFRQEWSQYVNHGYMPAVSPDTLKFNPNLERQFEKYVYSANVKLAYQWSDRMQFIGGVNNELQNNTTDGRGFIIPNYNQLNMGSFLFAKYILTKKSQLQAGIRYDYGAIKTTTYYDWFPSPNINNGDTTLQYLQRVGSIYRNFSNLSWSIGYNYNLENWLLKANIGKSFRMPIAKELAANGVNYHHYSYEIGNQNLSPEISYQLDLGLEYNSKRIAIGVSPFLNYFSNYIYLNPSYEHDRFYGNGNQIFYYTQSEVMRYGSELHAHYELLKPLQLGLIGEYVYSEQLSGSKKGFSLPFSPPFSAILNLKYHRNKIALVYDTYLSVDFKYTASQQNIVPPEEITEGNQLINVSVGGLFKIKNQKINVSMQVQNLLNSKYFNHTSYYRLINVPEPGRNFVINITIPFSTQLNTLNQKK